MGYWATAHSTADSSNIYRGMARAIRARIHTVKSRQARDELLVLAARYEKLAEYVEASSEHPSPTSADEVAAGESGGDRLEH